MKICFFTPAYPGKHDTSHYAFVKQLVDAIAAQGHECHIVVPYNVFHYKKLSVRFEKYDVINGSVFVYRPYFFSFSNRRGFRWIAKFSRRFALRKATKTLPQVDAVYAHFWFSGYQAFQYAKQHKLPLFVATGESDIKKMFQIPRDKITFAKYVSGVICVSNKNRDESIKLGLTTADKCGVFPNAVNIELFHKRDKNKCRQQLGFSPQDFIIAYVGWFNERKGPLRVAAAINSVGRVKSLFIGKGEQDPQCEGILFKGALPHEDVPLYLGAADCFVLPTQAEGCCNAVVEAMACGLPIISSNLPFNWDVLNESNSIMIDPNNVDEIAKAIRTLRDNPEKCRQLADGSLKTAENLTVSKRADNIIKFIESRIKFFN